MSEQEPFRSPPQCASVKIYPLKLHSTSFLPSQHRLCVEAARQTECTHSLHKTALAIRLNGSEDRDSTEQYTLVAEMPITTIGIGAAVTPTVYTNRKPRRQKPTAHISYDEGLHLIRSFLEYASHHTVDDLQAFTSQWVPTPSWVRTENVTIPQEQINKAADTLIAQLGEDGVKQVGGTKWWQWRQKDASLKAEWIEMRSDYHIRKQQKEAGQRIMLYVHGGAYFFGSVDEHRYQMQRHARKLKARVFAPRYRLSPQFPFPCGLLDCLAAYLYLLSVHDKSEIVFAGDSAGGGMILSLLCMLRDQGLPLPAGAILISPWVDLTHSFPSVAGNNDFDYIPPYGFMHKPSTSWPPPNDEDMEKIRAGAGDKLVQRKLEKSEVQKDKALGFAEYAKDPNFDSNGEQPTSTKATAPGAGRYLTIEINGRVIELKDQIQMYATNQLISHPLVSPALQPSLGGLCPLLILTGGGEVLRDEQIYVAHKAANPTKYPLGDEYHARYDPQGILLNKYKPTPVQLQVWEDLCHVAPTLSFTRPAKLMYRSIAQFGAWALARAQKVSIEMLDDDDISLISESDTESDSDSSSDRVGKKEANPADRNAMAGVVGKAGDPIPPFKNHMIRQKVDRHGKIFPLEPEPELPALNMHPGEVGVIKIGPVKKWLDARLFWDTKYGRTKRKVQQKRVRQLLHNKQSSFGGGEVPPPSALAGRQHEVKRLKTTELRKSFGLAMWSGWGSKHDEDTIKREGEAEDDTKNDATPQILENGKSPSRRKSSQSRSRPKSGSAAQKQGEEGQTRSRSRRRTISVVDAGQVEHSDVGQLITKDKTLPQPDTEDTKAAPPTDDRTFLTPMFLPTFKTNPQFRDKATEATDSISVRTGTSALSRVDSDNASAIAIFAAPGITKKELEPIDASSLATTNGVSDAFSKYPEPASHSQHDETNTLNHGSRPASVLGGYDTPGSSRSVERLFAHQVDINASDEVGGTPHIIELSGQQMSTSSDLEQVSNKLLSAVPRRMLPVRSISSTAVVQAEGVVGVMEPLPIAAKRTDERPKTSSAAAATGGTGGEAPNVGATGASGRPVLYDRAATQYQTAVERL